MIFKNITYVDIISYIFIIMFEKFLTKDFKITYFANIS